MILVLTASNGETVWQSPTEVNVVRTFAVVNTTLYIASCKALDAFESRNGRLLWHQDINTVQILAGQDTLYLGYLNELPRKVPPEW